MKKLLLTLSVIYCLLSNAFVIVLISVATNGKSNENSLGDKTLNNQEMSEIVGGMTLKHNFFKQYGVVDNSGRNIYYTAYYQITPDNYMDKVYLNLLSNEIAAVQTTYNFQTNKITTTIVAVNQNDTTRMRVLTNGDFIKSKIDNFNNLINSQINADKVNIKYFR